MTWKKSSPSESLRFFHLDLLGPRGRWPKVQTITGGTKPGAAGTLTAGSYAIPLAGRVRASSGGAFEAVPTELELAEPMGGGERASFRLSRAALQPLGANLRIDSRMPATVPGVFTYEGNPRYLLTT